MIRLVALLALAFASGPVVAISWTTVDGRIFRSVDSQCVGPPMLSWSGNDLVISCPTGNLKIPRTILTFKDMRTLCPSVSAKRLPTVNDLTIKCAR